MLQWRTKNAGTKTKTKAGLQKYTLVGGGRDGISSVRYLNTYITGRKVCKARRVRRDRGHLACFVCLLIAMQTYLISLIQLCIFPQLIFFQPCWNLTEQNAWTLWTANYCNTIWNQQSNFLWMKLILLVFFFFSAVNLNLNPGIQVKLSYMYRVSLNVISLLKW